MAIEQHEHGATGVLPRQRSFCSAAQSIESWDFPGAAHGVWFLSYLPTSKSWTSAGKKPGVHPKSLIVTNSDLLVGADKLCSPLAP